MEVDLNIIKATQTSLGKYVKRPPLSEKLLKKPPFRFIHDIVTSVLKTTGFFTGLFEENELISENVKDREAKVAFLNKVIFVIAHTTGKKLTVKPSKIVSGQEPDKTNELFQCLAEALDKSLTSEDAVKKYKQLNGTSIEDKSKETKVETKKSPPKRKDEPTKSERNQINKNKSKENVGVLKEKISKKTFTQSRIKVNDSTKQKNVTKNESRKEEIDLNLSLSESLDVAVDDSININLDDGKKPYEALENKKEDLDKRDNNESLISESQTTIQTSTTSEILSPKTNDLTKGVDEDLSPNEKTLNATADINNPDDNYLKNTEETVKCDFIMTKEKTNKDSDSLDNRELETFSGKNNLQNIDNSIKRPSSARPTSSRPSAPRLREKLDSNLGGNNITIVGKVNIISENVFPEEDEESSIIIQTGADLDTKPQQIEPITINDHGHLVQQILDSQKEFSTASGKTEIEWQFEAQKARDDMNKDIEQLRFNIQALSRLANPLGKLLDHIQEDVEVMRQESFQWIQTCEETTKELAKQKAQNEELLQPLHSKIKQLEAEIIEKREKINDLKIIVHKNNTRIERLLASGSVQ